MTTPRSFYRRVPVQTMLTPHDYLEQENASWPTVAVSRGPKAGMQLGLMTEKELKWWMENWKPQGQRPL